MFHASSYGFVAFLGVMGQSLAVAAAPKAPSRHPQASPAGQASQPDQATIPSDGAAKRLADWNQAYAEARVTMLAGRFQEAAATFALLVASAPDLATRTLATEMRSICETWARGGLSLAGPNMAGSPGSSPPEDRRTTDEIAVLYTNAVFYGIYAGIVVDAWSKANSAGGLILPPLAFAAGAAGLVAVLDHGLHLGYGVAQSVVTGMYVGFEEGIAWSLWHEARVPGSSEWGARAVTSLILGTGTLGAITGGVVGAKFGTTPGRASLMGSAAMWSGLVAGTLMEGLSGHKDTALLTSAIVLNAGAVAGGLLGAQVSPSIARVRFVDLGALSGGLLVGGLYWAAEDKHATARGVLTATGLGMTSGLVTAWILTRGMEPDLPRKHREPSLAERLVPTVAPTNHGTGLMVGLASAI